MRSPKELEVEERDKGLKEENMWGSRPERECQKLNGGKFWQSDGLCKDFRLYCLRCLCFSHHGVLSFKIRLLCLRTTTLGLPGPCNRKCVCVCMPNLMSWRLVVLKCELFFFFLNFVHMWIRKRELVVIEVHLWACDGLVEFVLCRVC